MADGHHLPATMDAKGKEKGILKLEPRPRIVIDVNKTVLTPQGSYELAPSSPQPSVDRLSVTWADPSSMNSSGVNLFHLPSETPASNEVKFSPTTGDGSDDEDYSASLSAVLRQRRASVRRSRKGRTRRPSSPFLADECRPRRRSSVFTTSSGDTAISIEEGPPMIVTQEQIFENIHLHKEVLGSVKQQPLGMRRKLKIVHQAKAYIKRHEGQLQERLAQSKCTRDIYARFNILMASKWQQLKREAANTSNLLIPWELRIKEIESHFGSVVASYFTFLRWLFWVNLVIGFILLVFVIVPEYLTADPKQDGERKVIMEEERRNATNLLTLWEFDGVLKCSAIFYGYYSNVERAKYRMPLAYFLTGLVVYVYSFVAILRKMAENSRMSKLSEKEDECIFSWKLFTGWDFMIGNTETAHNRIASVILGFKEALLEEAEKKKDLRNWRIISLRAIVNICVAVLLGVSAYAVVYVVSYPDDDTKVRSWWRENETTIVVTVISITFPVFFELLGFLEHYHPRKQLRLQLARIMLLNLLNLYSLIFALFSKIEGMSSDLAKLQPKMEMNATMMSISHLNESALTSCFEERISCGPCTIELTIKLETDDSGGVSAVVTTPMPTKETTIRVQKRNLKIHDKNKYLMAENLVEEPSINIIDSILLARKQLKKLRNITLFQLPEIVNETIDNTTYNDYVNTDEVESTTLDSVLSGLKEFEKIRNISLFMSPNGEEPIDTSDYEDYSFYDTNTDIPTVSTLSGLSSTFDDGGVRSTEYVTSEVTHASTISSTIEDITESNTAFTIDEFYTSTEISEGTSETTTEDSFSSYNETSESSIDIDLSSENTLINAFTSTYEGTTDTEFTSVSEATSDLNESTSNLDQSTTKMTSQTEDFTTKVITETNSQERTSEALADHFQTTSPSDLYGLTSKPTTYMNELTTKYVTPDVFQAKSTLTLDTNYFKNITAVDVVTLCPNITFNCTVNCGRENVTQVFIMYNCTIVSRICYVRRCKEDLYKDDTKNNYTGIITTDVYYFDENNRKMYNLTLATKRKLRKLCWETMFGQELVKLTMMDLVFVLLGTLFMDFFRALFVRYMNRCWCWDLEKKFPEYGDFKIAENILHLINNQGMVWMGMFFSPGLVVLNVVKLMIMMYLRSWAVMTCNVPHAVVFRVSKSNNFYLALLLTMLFLCVLPVGYTIVWVKPSWHCGPFSEYDKIYEILTTNIYKILPKSLSFVLGYIASPAIVIPLLVLLILIIYYLTSLTNSLREANNDLKIQLRRERTEERRKMFQLADNRRRTGSSAMDNTPFARWKKALPSLPLSKSIDSEDRKTLMGEDIMPLPKSIKKRGGIFEKIVNMALDKKSAVETVPEISDPSPSPNNADDETDTDFHESLPKEVLKAKDITIIKHSDQKKKNSVEFKTTDSETIKKRFVAKALNLKLEKDERTEKKAMIDKQIKDSTRKDFGKSKVHTSDDIPEEDTMVDTKMNRHQTSQSSTQSRQSDSVGSVIPVITISTTESDEEILGKKETEETEEKKDGARVKKSSSDIKSLRRQSSVDSINEQKVPKEKKPDNGHKYQYSL